jgi:hypothetical protein
MLNYERRAGRRTLDRLGDLLFSFRSDAAHIGAIPGVGHRLMALRRPGRLAGSHHPDPIRVVGP